MHTERGVRKHFTAILIITGRNEVVAKVIFLHLFVILFTGGGGGGIPQGTEADPPDQAHHPTPQTRHITPPGHDTPPPPPGPDTPPPPGPGAPRPDTPQARPPRTRPPPPPREADSGIRSSTSGRYASYWNAFLLQDIITGFKIL